MIETLAYDLETDLLIEIVKMLVTGDIDALDWRTKKLQQMGLLDRRSQELVNRYRVKILSGVDKEFEQTIENEIRIIRQGLPKTLRNQITMDTTTRMVMETWATQAKRNINMSLVNITETTKATYINAINKASLGYVTNTYTRDEALKQSITQMKHLEVYLDTRGRRWTPEGYVSMVLKSNKRQVVTDLQLGAAQELGTDIIEVSEHAGARPGCAPYQGRFFSTANRSGSITDGAGNRIYFEPLSSTTYGQPAGLTGINCGHRFKVFVPGISIKGQKLEMTADENREIYAQSQQQRRIENQIRTSKREIRKWEAAGDTQQVARYKEQLAQNNARMKEFISESGRTRRTNRERIY